MKKHLFMASLWAAVGLRAELPPPIFRTGERILFHGDSITDGNRGRTDDPNHILGHGYVFIIAAKFGAAYPDRRLAFANRGISGNTVSDLAAHWKKDALDLEPDVVSVLIGINDVWHPFQAGARVNVSDYETTYDRLLAELLAARPRVRFILCEPFALPGSANRGRWEEWQADLQGLQAAVERLAAKYQAPVVHFQNVFNKAAQGGSPDDYWLWDGVHPTYAGHQLMADEWISTFNMFYGSESAK